MGEVFIMREDHLNCYLGTRQKKFSRQGILNEIVIPFITVISVHFRFTPKQGKCGTQILPTKLRKPSVTSTKSNSL